MSAPATAKPSRPQRQDGDRHAGEPAPKPSAVAPAAPERRRHNDADLPVVGMGDHVPMFLLRPAKVKPEKSPGDNDDPGKNTRMG